MICCDCCDRYLIVLMENDMGGDGILRQLPVPCIDTGMGYVAIVMILMPSDITVWNVQLLCCKVSPIITLQMNLLRLLMQHMTFFIPKKNLTVCYNIKS